MTTETQAPDPAPSLSFSDAVRIASGCKDYGGGYRGTDYFEAYQHGIATVVASLRAAAEKGLQDTQVRALHTIGAESAPAIPAPEGADALRTAAQKALDALLDTEATGTPPLFIQAAIDGLRAALAAPAPQEWRCPDTGRLCTPEDCDRVCFQAPAEAHGDERAAFEAHASEDGKFPGCAHRGADGEYTNPFSHCARRAWTAALAWQAAQPQPKGTDDDLAAHTVLSGVARHKVKDLIASGYRICGYTMERQGHRSAVVFDAAVRWLDDEQRHTLMFVEGARVQAPAPAHEATLTITAPNGDKIVAHGSKLDMATLERVIHAKTQAPAVGADHIADASNMVPAAVQSRSFERLSAEFDPWWERSGQFCRAGGGGYEKTFAFYAWHAALGLAGVELPSESKPPVQGSES